MPSITTTNNLITFTNDDATFQIAEYGQSSSLIIAGSNQNLLSRSTFALIYWNTANGPQVLNSNKVSYAPLNGQEGTLEVRFPAAVRMHIHCRAESDHFQFKLLDIVNTGIVPELVPAIAAGMVQLILASDAYGGFLPVVRTGDYLVAQVPLDADTHVHSTAMSNDEHRYAILTTGFAAVELAGVKMALVVCPKDQWLDRMQALEVQYNLPHPLIEGQWDKQHPDVRSSYLFADITLENHQEIIKYAKLGGFRQVMPYRWIWAENTGTYSISQANYGGQLNNLKIVADALHAEGLKDGTGM